MKATTWWVMDHTKREAWGPFPKERYADWVSTVLTEVARSEADIEIVPGSRLPYVAYDSNEDLVAQLIKAEEEQCS